ncbi:MAG: M23 family metallopeptidase, partial [Actinobacteria bacterium]|nr:M23 family metallopeptidase [Actinomycetota bacterium]NIS36209.1 M23 family metallopeptidase [Actinomycetota bacterium]NIT97342.1 M23 family metallopeptidase [Actinomycetota bacterium]NIU21008.1 M23 family metallopeptidase [Actinomycetota bacterium]NIU70775.1 M23 family metallopeptidase [Actinomycetota bacterium]
MSTIPLLASLCIPAAAVLAPFAPAGDYAGHWGIDVPAEPGSQVTSPVPGWVTFAGSVAGMRSVTVAGGAVRVSFSYLADIAVEPGERVAAGDPVGTA